MRSGMRMMFNRKLAAAPLMLGLSLALSGCISFGSKPPEQLLSLDAARKVPAGTVRSAGDGRTLIINEPEAPKMLDTVRVPVQVTPTSVAYVTKTQWSDTPRHLFRRLLAETISSSTDRIVLDSGQFSGDGGQRLMGELVAFGIDAMSNSAVVTYDAMIASPNGVAIARQRFTASTPIGGEIGATTVGVPLNASANKVAADVAAWVAAIKE